MDEEDVLYHYTSISALNGILTSRNVWASDCRFLNDQKELINAIDIFINKFDGNVIITFRKSHLSPFAEPPVSCFRATDICS